MVSINFIYENKIIKIFLGEGVLMNAGVKRTNYSFLIKSEVV